MNNEYNKKEGSKERLIGIGIVAGVIVLTLVIVMLFNGGNSKMDTIYVATGGGKEDFLADEEIAKILKKDYKIDVVYDSWSNGKTVTAPLVREYVHEGNSNVSEYDWSVNNDSCSKYDALFTSDERFYDYYKLAPKDGEAARYTVLDGGLTLNTPIVIYSWGEVVDALIKEKIVTLKDGVYYITDMDKLINYILDGKKWSDIGLDNLYGNVNIASTDPVSSSPGATYYGLLLSILSESQVTTENINSNLPKLKDFYIKSGYMNNTPADLFERYLKTGMGGEPMIVDYEKSMIDFANSSPLAFEQVKDDIRVLYPTPTIWNSHCFTVFSENGQKLYDALNDPEIGQIAWERYGFRTGITGGSYDVSKFGIGVPQSISSTVTSLKMDTYNKLIDYLKNN